MGSTSLRRELDANENQEVHAVKSLWPMSVCVCALLLGCGETVAPESARGGSPAPSMSESAGTHTAPAGPKINWDHPEGLDTDLAHAGQVGQLPFPATDPGLGRTADVVRVSDPHDTPGRFRQLTMLFHFPVGSAEFPTDGRVLLSESPADIDATSLSSMAASNDFPDASYELFAHRGGSGLLMINTRNGVGRVILLLGGLKYDLTGPALPASTARLLADKL